MDEETCPICCSTDIFISHDENEEEHECSACGEVWFEDSDPAFDEYVLTEGDDEF